MCLRLPGSRSTMCAYGRRSALRQRHAVWRERIGAVERGEIDAISMKARAHGATCTRAGMRFSPRWTRRFLRRLEAVGLRRGLIEQKYFPKLTADIPTLDFSGWPIYTGENTSDDLVIDFCRALEASKDRVPWAKDAPLPLAQMVRDTPKAT